MFKRSLVFVLVLVMISIMSISVAFAAEAKTAKAFKGTPVIDAAVDAVWSDIPAITDFQQAGVLILGEKTDVKPAVRVMWDEKCLYVLAEVTDDKVVGNTVPPDDLCHNDGIEIYIDQDNAKKFVYQPDDIWVKIDYAGTIVDEKKSGGDIKASSQKVSGGYVIEAAIPWSTLKPVAGTTIGFDIAVNDNKTGKGRTSWVLWNDGTSNAWQSPKVFGNLKLAEAAGPIQAAGAPSKAAKAGNQASGSNPKTGDTDLFAYVAGLLLAAFCLFMFWKKAAAPLQCQKKQ